MVGVNFKQDKFRDLAENIPILCWMANPDGHIFWYNRHWYEYTGTTPAEMEGWGWQSVHDPATLPSVLERWRDSIATGHPFEMIFPLRRADGEFCSFLTRINPTRDAAGAVTGWYGVNIDISEQVKAAEERSLIARELGHRIKNIFSVVSGLISISSKSFPEAKRFANDLRQRVAALGRAHDFVRPRGDDLKHSDTTVFVLFDELLAPYKDGERCVVRGHDVKIDDGAVTSLSLLLHELATNAAKYGALSEPSGVILVETFVNGSTFDLVWREEGGPVIEAPSRSGFGSSLARLSVEGQMQGSLGYNWRSCGLIVTARIPMSAMYRGSLEKTIS